MTVTEFLTSSLAKKLSTSTSRPNTPGAKLRGSMTSWRCLTPLFLCVFLGTILQSEAGCWDLFKPNNWNDERGQTYGIKNTNDVKDVMECSAGQICHDTKEKMCSVITSCYFEEDATVITEECQKASVSHNVSHYDFMCLMAKDIGFVPPHGFCQYEAVLELYSKIAANPSSAESVKLDGSGRESVTLKGFLVISVALNVLLPLFLFLFMRRRQKQNLWDSLHGNAEGNSARARVEITVQIYIFIMVKQNYALFALGKDLTQDSLH
ncbi:uncharacterized protein LOC117535438 [Gymnodraco acuticeps]|uniref:Uncharacterized protein LOC117535438 n=1 Tax=Gymnodraco acuticeps TaxID=8218 RepID=A0A6P8TB05_GYMAC|nr:uncharacterized protein LOC117535438 [Gymnodraco acuticeps]